MRHGLIGLLISCGTTVGPPNTVPVSTTTSQTTSTTTSTTSSTTTPAPDYDCDDLPTGLLPFTQIENVRPVEDFAFDDQGHLISHDMASALVTYDYPWVNPQPFAATPGSGGGPASLRLLQNGDVVYANVDTSTLYRVTLAGQTTVLYGAFAYPTGIDIHDSGRVLIADLTGIFVIDADAQTAEVTVPSGAFLSPNGITYNADYSQVIIGDREGIWTYPVDADSRPTAAATLLAVPPDNAETLGMGVDICDNLYVLLRNKLLRYGPDGGEPEELLSTSAGAWLTNLQWGSGVGGWDDQTVYIIDRGSDGASYYAVDVGVPSKPY